MATVGKKNEDTLNEVEVDAMRDAPPARPYHEAVSNEHRAFLASRGVVLPPAERDVAEQKSGEQKSGEQKD